MRIIIAEDSVLLLEGLLRLLRAEGHEVTGVGTAEELLSLVESEAGPPDLIVTDVRMPPGHSDEGLRAAILLRRLYSSLPILVLSQYIESRYATELFANGADSLGYLLKDRIGKIDEFLDAVSRVSTGGTVIDPEVVAQLLVRATKRDGLAQLTDAERGVLALMAQGRSNSAIAESLYVSLPTVEKRISAIFTKLGLATAPDDHRRVLAVLRHLDATSERNPT